MKLIRGAISVAAVISGATVLIAGVFTAVVWVYSVVAPVQAQTNMNTADIASLHADIGWVKEALRDNGFQPRSQIASSTR